MKTFSKKQLFVIVVTVSTLVLFVFLYSISSFNEKLVSLDLIQTDLALLATNTPLPYQQKQMESLLPIRLKIPEIKVDVAIEHVGLLPIGAMDTPKDRDNVAWFSPGTRPGENGSAVIAGHSGYKSGEAAFDNLNKLRKGDRLYVEDALGKYVSFVVRESRVYDSEAYAPEVFMSDDGMHLNLVTCVGAWDKSKKSYTQRLVVFTDIIQ
ncbi:MAG: class F sortase [Candidatus Paceibacterota bacterium]